MIVVLEQLLACIQHVISLAYRAKTSVSYWDDSGIVWVGRLLGFREFVSMLAAVPKSLRRLTIPTKLSEFMLFSGPSEQRDSKRSNDWRAALELPMVFLMRANIIPHSVGDLKKDE